MNLSVLIWENIARSESIVRVESAGGVGAPRRFNGISKSLFQV